MKKTNKIIGALVISTLAFGLFTGGLSDVSAAGNTAVVRQNSSGMGMHFGRNNGGMREEVANFLGIDSSKVIASRQEGKSLVQIAQEQGKSEDELFDYMFSKRKAQINQMIDNGQISAEVAANHEALMKERIRENINRTEVGPKFAGNNKSKHMGQGRHNRGNGQGYCLNN